MKAVLEKSKIYNDKFPKSLDINNEEIADKKIITETFNTFFINNLGSNLVDKIPPSRTIFESYLPNTATALIDKPSSEKEFKDAFFTLKPSKSLSYDNLHVNVITRVKLAAGVSHHQPPNQLSKNYKNPEFCFHD